MTDVREIALELENAINAFNASTDPKIELVTTRDGRTMATLPRAARQIIVFPNQGGSVRPTPRDVAWLCEEARRAASPTLAAAAPSLALIEAALGSLEKLEELKPATQDNDG